MKTLMRNGRDRRSENPFLGHARKERVSLFGTDQRITSGPAATRLHSKAEYMTAPERFADSQIPLAPRAPSIHDPDMLAKYGPRPRPSSVTERENLGTAFKAKSRALPGSARAKEAPGRVATGGSGTGRACLPDRPPRDGGVPRRHHRRKSAR